MKENIEILISSNKLQKRIKEIANEIKNDYQDEEVVFVSVLKGAIFFTVDLMKNYLGDAIIDVVRVSSYNGENSTGNIELKIPLKKENIEGKNIVIVEDIIDTGRTFNYLVDYIGKMNPKSIKSCVMLDKPSRRVEKFECDYVGFKIEDLFVIGYGLDYDEKYRNLPYIGYIKK
ncbi:MAG: hypoxanthine phosphoribosyltransferase [Bacilli bacterium]|nr:hypoxanthine phosphoribosyltransferase [Bacilli bacterium]